MRIGKIPVVSAASAIATPEDSSFMLLYAIGNDFFGKKSDGTSVIVGGGTGTGDWSFGGNPVVAEQSIGTTTVFDVPLIADNVEVARLKTSGDFQVTNSITSFTDPLRTVNMTNGALNDAAGVTRLNWESGILLDAAGASSLDWQARTMYDAAAQLSIDYDGRFMKDAAGVNSLNYELRRLYKSTGGQTIDWENQILYDAVAAGGVSWGTYDLWDSTGNASLNWQAYSLKDSVAVEALNWNFRYLKDPAGNIMADWSLEVATFAATNLRIATELRINHGIAHDTAVNEVTLVGGTKDTANPLILTTSLIFLTRHTPGGGLGHLSYDVSVAGVLTIDSDDATETSTISYLIINP